MSSFAGERGGALVRIGRAESPHSPEEIRRARRAVALQTERGLPAEDVPEILAMLGLDVAPKGVTPKWPRK